MAIATGTALLIGAGLSAAGTALSASKASKAAKTQADLQAQAAADANALQERIYNQNRQDQEPFRQAGVNALNAVSGGFGLPSVSMTGVAPAPAPSRTSVAGAQGFGGTPSMTNLPTSYATRGYGGQQAPAGYYFGPDDRLVPIPGGDAGAAATAAPPQEPRSFAPTGVSMTGGSGGPPMADPTRQAASGGPDYAAYLAANPDVAENAKQRVADGTAQSVEQVAAEHWQNYGQKEGRTLPKTPATVGPAPGYADPTAPNGYMTGPRPDSGPGPAAYTPTTLDLSLDKFHTSPDYAFRVKESERALGNLMSAGGGLYSGRRIKAGLDRAQNLADAEYTDWRNFETSRYDTNRQFDYGQSRDARGDFVQDRSRTDGLFADDRSNTNQRYDTRNNQLMSLAGFGSGANAANQNAAQTFAQTSGNNLMTAANAKGAGAVNSANAWSNGINNLITTGAYLAGNYMTGGTTPSLPKQWSI